MRKFLLLSSAALSLFAVGCVSAETVCETGIETTCDKVFACTPDAAKGSESFKGVYGTSAADCKSKLIASKSCSSKKDVDELCTGTDAGKKYDLGNASDCSDGIKALSCDDFNAGKFPAVCTSVCK